MTTTIRKLGPEEGMLFKRLRLGALKESPDAFSPTWEDSSAHDDQYWLKSAQRLAATENSEIFIAEHDGQSVGLVSGYADEELTGHIGAMWADPKIRGKGIGRHLLLHVVSYLRDSHCQLIELTVTETNHTAINLYQNIRFTFTGNDVPLREGSTLLNREMTLTQS
jgi:ribosomal protein S18 acetylase RimI-like enzyme